MCNFLPEARNTSAMLINMELDLCLVGQEIITQDLRFDSDSEHFDLDLFLLFYMAYNSQGHIATGSLWV